MAEIPHIFIDAALLTKFDDAVHTLDAEAVQGADGDGWFWVGIADADNSPARKLQAASDPGVDPLVVSIVDASPGGGVEAAHIKLALTQVDLGSAVAGDPVNLPATIQGGAVNAVKVWFRWANSVGGSTYTEISLSLVERIEVAA